MKSIVSFLLSLLLLSTGVQAFTSPTVSTKIALLPKQTTTTSLNVFGTKKSKAAKEAEAAKAAMYWEGDWVCKDCGYIYQRVSISIKEFYIIWLMFMKVKFFSLISHHCMLFVTTSIHIQFPRYRENALVCSLKNKDQDSVAHNALVQDVVMQRKLVMLLVPH